MARRVVIPFHGSRDIDKTVVGDIIADMGITVDEFVALL